MIKGKAKLEFGAGDVEMTRCLSHDVDNVLCQLNDILCDEIDQPVADCVAEAVRGGGVDGM